MDALNRLLIDLSPVLLEIIAGLLTALLSWVVLTLRQRWGIEIEARHREALQSAMMNGARIALARGLSGAAAADLAQGYAQASVPDAMRNLRPSEAVLAQLARAKLHEVTQAKAAEVGG